MKFNVVGSLHHSRKGILLHAMAVDAREFVRITEILSEDYCLILPTFDGHHAEDYVPFPTLTEQVDKILAWLAENNIDELDFIAGTSLGALAAFEIYKRGVLRVHKYVFDGGPFFEMNRGGRIRLEILFCCLLGLAKLPFAGRLGGKWFAPELIQMCAQGALTKKDIHAICESIFDLPIPEPLNAGNTQLVFCYGNENAFRSYRRFKGLGGHTLVRNDYGHCGFVAHEPEAYAAMLVTVC
jgi:hypothetical protein